MNYSRRKFIKQGGWSFLALGLMPALLNAENKKPEMIEPRFKPEPNTWDNNKLSLAWMGHSTILLNFYGLIIITDPVLFDNIGLPRKHRNWGPKRLTRCALCLDDIPKPDLILLSHAHMDHMDLLTLRSFTSKYPGEIDCITSYKTSDIIQEFKFKSLKEIDWTEELDYKGCKIKGLEVRHFGWRFPWEKDRSRGNPLGRSYNAYLLEKNGKKIVFGGDTAMTDCFQNLKFEKIDIAIIPIGAYNPWVKSHCNPEEALKMAEDMNTQYFIPIHCNTFALGYEPFDEPLSWLEKSHTNYNITLAIKEIGQTFVLPA